jgi:uncharacterized protein DUF3592
VTTWTSTTRSNKLTTQGLIALFGVFAGLCTVFALFVTAAEAWSEHAQQSWPQATATIERCSVDPYYPFRSQGRQPLWHIECRITFLVHGGPVEAKIRSRSTNSSSDTESMNRWVAQHRPGSPIVIHYDPADQQSAVLIATDMPDAGPRTPNNIRLTLIAAAACIILLTIARLLRAREGPTAVPA